MKQFRKYDYVAVRKMDKLSMDEITKRTGWSKSTILRARKAPSWESYRRAKKRHNAKRHKPEDIVNVRVKQPAERVFYYKGQVRKGTSLGIHRTLFGKREFILVNGEVVKIKC